ncbi:hypothetical protein AB0451_33930 [Streptomyces sp. NPDC052000]|uniref:hypothetical protein n=1 Tax=Streptomyces sp. NPDC052000 TaxID=3155676 RepID=UPI00344D8D40
MVDTLILDLLDLEEARRPPMAVKDYSDEFKVWRPVKDLSGQPAGFVSRASMVVYAASQADRHT